MSVHLKITPNGAKRYVVRWREGDRNRSRAFARKRDAEAFDAEVERRRQLGPIAVRMLDAGRDTLDQYVASVWVPSHAVTLAPKTRAGYTSVYDRHVSPTLGDLPLREITTEAIATWRGQMLKAGTSRDVIHRAMKLLGSILQRAAEGGRIPHNPARLVAKPKREATGEVRPLAPVTVEAIRDALLYPSASIVAASKPGKRRRKEHAAPRRRGRECHADATLVSVLAYAGLRPHEARALRWEHVRDRTLLVAAAGKTGQRTVRLLEPLAADLTAWRLACGSPSPDSYVFPGANPYTPTSANAFEKWRQRVYVGALKRAKLARSRPYDLRHSFASLLLHEGRSVIYVARQLGHGADLTLKTYGHVIDELEDSPNVSAEDAIAAARHDLDGRSTSALARITA